jgi:hypothetical protein
MFQRFSSGGGQNKNKGGKGEGKSLRLKNTFEISKAELIRGVQRAEGNFDGLGTAQESCDQF